MKRARKESSETSRFSSGVNLGGEVSLVQDKHKIYSQGEPADTLFYIQKGGVSLTYRAQKRRPAVTAILGVGDLFGELCLAGYPLRMSTAIALTPSSIRTIKKTNMLRLLHGKNGTSNELVAYLLSSVKKHRDHVAELLTSSAEQRLARILLRLSHLNNKGRLIAQIPLVSQQILAEMVGTTRSRINFFMNRFRRKGFINYDGDDGLKVRQSLRAVLRAR